MQFLAVLKKVLEIRFSRLQMLQFLAVLKKVLNFISGFRLQILQIGGTVFGNLPHLKPARE